MLLMCHCSQKEEPSTAPPVFDVDANLSLGWERIIAGDYDRAEQTFSDVLDHSADHPEALLGKGWSFAFLADYDSSIATLQLAAESDSIAIDVNMGLAVVYRDYPNLRGAIEKASDVIESNPDYVFSRIPSIDYKDAHLIKAQCHYRIGGSDLELARMEIDLLCDLLDVDHLPDPGTVPGDEYNILMAQKLEQLTALVEG
jgi:tetratricopeptide (TPR) repeat protein